MEELPLSTTAKTADNLSHSEKSPSRLPTLDTAEYLPAPEKKKEKAVSPPVDKTERPPPPGKDDPSSLSRADPARKQHPPTKAARKPKTLPSTVETPNGFTVAKRHPSMLVVYVDGHFPLDGSYPQDKPLWGVMYTRSPHPLNTIGALPNELCLRRGFPSHFALSKYLHANFFNLYMPFFYTKEHLEAKKNTKDAAALKDIVRIGHNRALNERAKFMAVTNALDMLAHMLKSSEQPLQGMGVRNVIISMDPGFAVWNCSDYKVAGEKHQPKEHGSERMNINCHWVDDNGEIIRTEDRVDYSTMEWVIIIYEMIRRMEMWFSIRVTFHCPEKPEMNPAHMMLQEHFKKTAQVQPARKAQSAGTSGQARHAQSGEVRPPHDPQPSGNAQQAGVAKLLDNAQPSPQAQRYSETKFPEKVQQPATTGTSGNAQSSGDPQNTRLYGVRDEAGTSGRFRQG